jgi:ABC-type glycerol-3-phosphate transport system substrate-binding protein
VGALPQELGAYVDISVAATANASSAAEAQAFIKFVTSPESASLWTAGGLSPSAYAAAR